MFQRVTVKNEKLNDLNNSFMSFNDKENKNSNTPNQTISMDKRKNSITCPSDGKNRLYNHIKSRISNKWGKQFENGNVIEIQDNPKKSKSVNMSNSLISCSKNSDIDMSSYILKEDVLEEKSLTFKILSSFY